MTLDPRGDLVRLFRDIVDIESVSGDEGDLADAVESALRDCAHLSVLRDGDTLAITPKGVQSAKERRHANPRGRTWR